MVIPSRTSAGRVRGVLFRLGCLKIDGLHWFRWGFFHLPGKPIYFSKRPPMGRVRKRFLPQEVPYVGLFVNAEPPHTAHTAWFGDFCRVPAVPDLGLNAVEYFRSRAFSCWSDRQGMSPTVDGRNSAPPKKPWNHDSPLHTNKNGFPCFFRWCRILSSTVCFPMFSLIRISPGSFHLSFPTRTDRKFWPQGVCITPLGFDPGNGSK